MPLNKYYLGDLITQRREKNPGGNLPIRGVSRNGLQKPKQIDADTSIYNLYYKNDFVYNPARMELGSIAFNDEFDMAICSSLYEVFYVHRTDILLPEYLALFVKLPEFARYCNYLGNGSAREYCRFDSISRISIALPSISEQEKAVRCNKVLSDRIQLLSRINTNLESQLFAVLENMILNNIEAPLWDTGFFEQLIVNSSSGDWGTDLPEKNNTEEVICIRGADIPDLCNGICLSAPTRYILKKNYETKALSENSAIVEISGGSPTQSTGRIVLITEELLNRISKPIICSNFCKGVTVNKRYRFYFYLLWKYLYNANRMFSYENSTIGLKNFDFATFTTQESIAIPPVDVINKFNSFVEPIYKLLLRNGFEMETLVKIKDKVIPQLMS